MMISLRQRVPLLLSLTKNIRGFSTATAKDFTRSNLTVDDGIKPVNTSPVDVPTVLYFYYYNSFNRNNNCLSHP